MKVKIVKLKIENITLHHDVKIMIPQDMEAHSVSASMHDAYNTTAQLEVYKTDVKRVMYKGVEHTVALDKDAQELVDMFVELSTCELKLKQSEVRGNYLFKISQLAFELKLAKRSWWDKFKSWLS